MRYLFCCLLLLVSTAPALALTPDAPWVPVGPDGGDARRFAADPAEPKHLYMGTTTSWLYQSSDGGSNWKRLARLSREENLVLDSIIVDAADPKTLLIGTWVFDHTGGALFLSHDSGITWQRVKDMDGQSIRALAESRSDSKVYIAGTLTGVYRSEDHGEHWALISPEGSKELHEVESIAIDPINPKNIFAGTWHLPWKTTDGGVSWHTIKQGVIDDSDVFSIILDPKQPATMYASACSGIYKSLDAGELFHKVQGIPATARRTRVLMQDPVNLDVVYAGTTEGLYQTTNAGALWVRVTGPDVVVNDVFVDPSDRKHVLMATDRSGVLLSDDAGITFRDANTGFSQRQVAALMIDSRNPHTFYAGVLNDKTYGGVFVSDDSGAHWKQQSNGLGGLDVFSLAEASDGILFAGTSHGLFRWSGSTWEQNGKILHSQEQTRTILVHKKRKKVTKTIALPATMIDSRVNAIDVRGSVWYAATATGIYLSSTQGANWEPAGPQVTPGAQAPGQGTGQESAQGTGPGPSEGQAKGQGTESTISKPYLDSTPAKTTKTEAKTQPRANAKKTSSKKETPAETAAAQPIPAPPPPISYRLIDASGPIVYAAGRQTLADSDDQGKTWQTLASGTLIPASLTSVDALATTPDGAVWVGGREGAFYSTDKGQTWVQLKIPTAGISGLNYDSSMKRLLVTSRQSTLIFAIDPTDKTWKWWESGWNLHGVSTADGRLLGPSRYDGIVMQPPTELSQAAPGGR